MSDDFFDIERLRRNWAPLPEETIPALPSALEKAGVAPPEPLETARALLADMERIARRRFPAQGDTLGAFFYLASTLLEQHRQGPVAPPGQNLPEEEPAPARGQEAEPLSEPSSLTTASRPWPGRMPSPARSTGGGHGDMSLGGSIPLSYRPFSPLKTSPWAPASARSCWMATSPWPTP